MFACLGAYDADYRGCKPSICSKSEECRVITQGQSAPRETFDEIWQDVDSDLATLERLYIADAKVRAESEAKKSFRERLREMLSEIVKEESVIV